jgi:hypothetical protein
MTSISARRTPTPLSLAYRALREQPPESSHHELAEAVLGRLLDDFRLVPRRPVVLFDHTPLVSEGEITSRDIIIMALAFDEISGDERWTASDFAAWMVAEIRGSPEQRWLEQRRLR